MTNERAIEVIQTEKKCVARANICDRNCAKCYLVLPEEDILTAYDMAIKALGGIRVTAVYPDEKVIARIVNASNVVSLDEDDLK